MMTLAVPSGRGVLSGAKIAAVKSSLWLCAHSSVRFHASVCVAAASTNCLPALVTVAISRLLTIPLLVMGGMVPELEVGILTRSLGRIWKDFDRFGSKRYGYGQRSPEEMRGLIG